MKPKKSLQKFTKPNEKLAKLLLLEQITHKDLEGLNEAEINRLMENLTEQFNKLRGTERDLFYNKIEPIVGESTKNQLWENNHNQITWAISTLMQEYGRMPSKTEIAAKTELSRQTVNKHLNDYASHPQYLGQIEQFRFMSSKVLAKVFQYAVNGDTAAAKLYFNLMGFMKSGQSLNNTLVQNQNNYIQINGMFFSQETLGHLNPEQLNTIESILKSALPQPVDGKDV